jgi:hypothetical protein
VVNSAHGEKTSQAQGIDGHAGSSFRGFRDEEQGHAHDDGDGSAHQMQ